MTSYSSLPAGLKEFPVIGILRGFEPAATIRTVEAVWRAGLKLVEITLNSPDACGTIASLRNNQFRRDGAMIGAGTVTTIDGARAAVDAGAEFLVTPIADASIVEWAAERNIPIFPGAFSPTEVFHMWRAGATAVKIFPASVLGVEFIKALRGPMPQVPLLPTGGIGLENASGYLAAGAVGLGVGSPLFTPALLADESGAVAAEQIARWKAIL